MKHEKQKRFQLLNKSDYIQWIHEQLKYNLVLAEEEEIFQVGLAAW